MNELSTSINIFYYIMESNALMFLNIILALTIVFFERKHVNSTLAWLMILVFLPGFGFILYIFFGYYPSKERIFTLKKGEDTVITDYITENRHNVLYHNETFSTPTMKPYKNLMELHLNHSLAPFSEDNDVDLFTIGDEFFFELFKSIEEATDHVHILFYIIKNDELGNQLRDLLVKKAEEGVEVRVLYDKLGSRTLNKEFFKPLWNAGAKTAPFFPNFLYLINFRINYRNHRKIVVIDGDTAFVGGFNVGDSYLGKDRLGYWRDTHIKIKGSAVSDLQLRFLLDWRHAHDSSLKIERESKYFKKSSPEPLATNSNVGVQIVSSGPDSEWQQIKYGYIKMIQDAKESIYIQTPYLVLDDSISEALKIASLSGKDVRVMIPCKPDHPFIYWATLSNAGELLDSGVKIYTYERGFLHAKTMVIDERVASVGTANFDIRSFRLNFEVNAFIYDSKLGKEFADAFRADMLDSKQLTQKLYSERSRYIKFKESISRLGAPLL